MDISLPSTKLIENPPRFQSWKVYYNILLSASVPFPSNSNLFPIEKHLLHHRPMVDIIINFLIK